jgi:hypothetical protein
VWRPDLSIDKAGVGYTLVAMSGTSVSATSLSFTVVAALVIVTGALPADSTRPV